MGWSPRGHQAQASKNPNSGVTEDLIPSATIGDDMYKMPPTKNLTEKDKVFMSDQSYRSLQLHTVLSLRMRSVSEAPEKVKEKQVFTKHYIYSIYTLSAQTSTLWLKRTDT